MERTISQEDRIRRAEEIYYRRKNNANIGKTTTVNLNPKKEYKLLKKIIIQILACVGIYFLIYSIQANTDSFSIDSIKYIKNMLSYDMDLPKYINEGKKYFANLYIEPEKEENTNIQNETIQNTIDVSEEAPKVDEEIKEEIVTEDISSLSQMEQDAKYIKEN